MSLNVENILDMIDSYGEDDVKSDLACFYCPKNKESYFTLTHKAIDISGSDLSNTSRKKLGNHSRYEADSDTYSTSAFLLAQFGKNYGVDGGNRITGVELMQCVMDILFDIQHRIGGGVVYLDAEDRPALKNFYENKANYKLFGERYSDTDKIKYLQYMRFL